MKKNRVKIRGMKNQATRTAAMALCGVLVFGEAGKAVCVRAANQQDRAEEEEPESTEKRPVASEDAEVSKDETVYVIAAADGSVQKIIVSDWLQNTLGAGTVSDWSELTNVENVKGDGDYTLGIDNTWAWDAKGDDIYYQGSIQKALPVNLSVTYTLDGRKVSSEELAGKSGRVTIRYDYTNNQYEYVDIDGTPAKMYVPFAVATGLLLDNEIFSNVEVTNGRLENDGNHMAVIGLAFPGLQENLDVDPEDFEIPDYLEITADVRNFELGMTAAVATNEVFSKIDTESEDPMEDLKDSMEELTDAMDQLMDGSSKLYDGMNTLFTKSDELVDGVDKLASGANELRDGIGTLDSGAGKLKEGAVKLSAGLTTLTNSSASLNKGAQDAFNGTLQLVNQMVWPAIKAQLSSVVPGLTLPENLTAENYSATLGGIISALEKMAGASQGISLDAALTESQASQAVSEAAAAEEEPKEDIEAGVQPEAAAEELEKTDIQQLVGSTEETEKENEENTEQNLEDEKIEEIGTEEGDEAGVQPEAATEEASVSVNGMAQMFHEAAPAAGSQNQSQAAALQTALAQLKGLKNLLDGHKALCTGIQTYTAGVAQAAAGSGELVAGTGTLNDGTDKLYSGATELRDGIQTMKDKTPDLTDGITKLCDGSLELSDGLAEFNEEGIQKLADAVDGDMDGLVTRIRAMSDVSRNYKSFAGISDEMDGQVKFIYRTESIEAGK